MKYRSKFYSLTDSLRSHVEQHSIIEVMVVTAYLFWSNPEATISATQRGEKALQNHFFEAFMQHELERYFDKESYQRLTLGEIFSFYLKLYEDFGKSKEQFSIVVAEWIFAADIKEQFESVDPGSSSQLMSEIAKLYGEGLVYDGAMGLGRLLYLLNPERFIGKEIMAHTAYLSRLLFTMLGREGDIQIEDALLTEESSYQADIVVSQPPLSMRLKPGINYDEKPYLLITGKVPSSRGDSLWIQESLYQVKEEGRVILQLPPGWFFRGGYDQALRQALIDRNWIETIIYLPQGLLNHTGINTNILILNKSKESATIRLIDTRELGRKGKLGKTYFTEEEVEEIVSLIESKKVGQYDFVKDVELLEIVKQEYNLDGNQYFSEELEIETLNIEKELKLLEKMFEDQQRKQQAFIKQIPYFIKNKGH